MSKKMVVITDHNEWEGEDFGFIIEMDEETIEEIKSARQEDDEWEIQENVSYTKEDVDKINAHSDNCYMDRLGFYRFCDNISQIREDEGFSWYDDVFYKGTGLVKIND